MKNKAKHARLKRYLRYIPYKLGLLKWSPLDIPGLVIWYPFYSDHVREFTAYNRAMDEDDQAVKQYYEWSKDRFNI